MGRPCRGALTALVARQYYEYKTTDKIHAKLDKALLFLMTAAVMMPDRATQLYGVEPRPVILYTDASTQDWGLRLGLLLCRPGLPSLCASVDVPEAVVQCWDFRETYIDQGELLAGPLAAMLFAEALRGQDVLWFIDNTGACTAMLKTSSPIEDNSSMAHVASFALLALRARPWYEYVPSDDNPSDPLSRDGYLGPGVSARIATGQWQKADTAGVAWDSLLTRDLSNIFKFMAALGG